MKRTYTAHINLPVQPHEVPDLREAVGWERRDGDYPVLLNRCNFWAGVRNEADRLIGFGYICGPGLQHGYMEDIMVHPDYQGAGVGSAIANKLLEEANRVGLELVSVTFAEEHAKFYAVNGFQIGAAGLWRR